MFGLFGGFNIGDLILPLFVGIFFAINSVIRGLFPGLFAAVTPM
jgi:hypothetical protein